MILALGLNEDGERISIITAGALGTTRLQPRTFAIEVDIDKKSPWSMEFYNREDFQEELDPEPMAIPVGSRELSMDERIREVIRQEKLNAEAQGFETFAESDDFGEDDLDDEDWQSPFEERDDWQEMIPEEPENVEPEIVTGKVSKP